MEDKGVDNGGNDLTKGSQQSEAKWFNKSNLY